MWSFFPVIVCLMFQKCLVPECPYLSQELGNVLLWFCWICFLCTSSSSVPMIHRHGLLMVSWDLVCSIHTFLFYHFYGCLNVIIYLYWQQAFIVCFLLNPFFWQSFPFYLLSCSFPKFPLELFSLFIEFLFHISYCFPYFIQLFICVSLWNHSGVWIMSTLI
jgi:hypothetical protein